MSNPHLTAALQAAQAEKFVKDAQETALIREVSEGTLFPAEQRNPARLPRLAFVFETQGIEAYSQMLAGSDDNESKRWSEYFLDAFTCWRSLASLGQMDPKTRSLSSEALQLVDSELSGEPVPAALTLAFRLAVSGLLASRDAEVRLELERFELETPPVNDWQERVSNHVFAAVALMIRKGGGWSDINAALQSIAELRSLQDVYEEAYLQRTNDLGAQQSEAVALVGLYNLAQIVSTLGDYLKEGDSSVSQLNSRLDRHHEQAVDAFRYAARPLLAHLSDLLWVASRELARNSIWTHITGTGARLEQFARVLTDKGRTDPVIELWPSQQQALQQRLLDTYARAIVVEMPTSAGKTLLAKFLIVQTKALQPSGTIAYVVPTRALVNQVTLDLREDFRELDPPVLVEQAVPAIELDPTEERLLGGAGPDVLVTTPEKLDLLIRRNHPSTHNLVLVVADEAHNLRDGERGARLELLLGIIRRDRSGARFLLLSPFLPNDQEIVSWLGQERSLPPIALDWKPSRKVVGAVGIRATRRTQELVLTTLQASDNVDISGDVEIPLGQVSVDSNSVYQLTRATVQAVRDKGAVLVLCNGANPAMKRAGQISDVSPAAQPAPLLDAVASYLDAEIGRAGKLAEYVRRGVAYHHAGLSSEARWLVESLIKRGHVDVICGTTTLAQGVNFPIRTVIIESLRKGREGSLTYEDFWNVAGRAGRALIDTVGVVAFPTATSEQRRRYQEFLRGEAEEITSQLVGLIERADQIGDRFSINALYRYPELAPLMQFLAHAVRVAAGGDVSEDLEDVLRASLAFHQAQRMGREHVRRLVRLCRAYLNQIQGRPDIVALADQTGFATPSVIRMLGTKANNPEFTAADNWQPDHLFGPDVTPLQRRIEAIADLPEMRLGQSHGGPFNPQRVAEILRDWVQGEPLETLSERYLKSTVEDPEERVSDFSRYLFRDLIGRASWGLGALEGVSLAGTELTDVDGAGYVPSMIFFGVKRKESVWLRMAGLPRIGADGLGALWEARQLGEPTSYEAIRSWVGGLSNSDWAQALPAGVGLTPQHMRILWREFAGSAADRPGSATVAR